MKTKLLALLALCCFVASNVMAEKEIYAFKNGLTITLYYDEDRASCGGILNWWEDESITSKTTKVVFDETMKNALPKYTSNWFNGFTNLTTIENIDYLNTIQVKEMRNMFYKCSSLTSLDLSTFNTANVTDMSGMFYGCSSLTSLNIGNFNTANVTTMSYMFARCGVKTLNIASFDTDNVTDMSYMFYQCSVKKLDFSWYNTDNVTNMSYMFAQCAVGKLDLSTFNTAKVTNMDHMFYNCYQLKSLNVKTFNTDKVKNMNSMFSTCYNLKSLDLRSFNTPKVEDMEKMFYGCSALTTIYCGNNWRSQLTVLSLTDKMFTDCTQLVGENGTTYNENYTNINYARPDGVDGKKGYFSVSPKEVYTVFNETQGSLTYYYDKYRTKRPGTTEVYDPDVKRFVDYRHKVKNATIDVSMKEAELTTTKNMFGGLDYTLDNLAEIIGLENLNTDNVTNMSCMFYGCYSLEYINVTSFNTENVTNTQEMFYGCHNLKTLDLNKFDFSQLKCATEMFEDCDRLTTIYCNEDWSLNPYLSTCSYKMFYGCTKLKGGNGTTYNSNHIDITYARPDGGTSKPGYFTEKEFKVYTEFVESTGTLTYYYDGLYSGDYVRLGEIEMYDPVNKPTAKRFPYYNEKVKVVKIDESMKNAPLTSTLNMFYGGNSELCLTSLVKIIGLENLNTENVTNMSGMFSGCSSLTSIDLSLFKTEKVKDMSSMFSDCSNLTSLDLSTFNTDKVTNMSNMFYKCSNLTSIDLSSFNTENVTDMSFMFYICKQLTQLDLSKFDTKKVTTMESMFDMCKVLKNLNIDAQKFYTSNVTNMSAMFADCQVLDGEAIDFTRFDTKNVTDMSYMFFNCMATKSIDLSKFNTDKVTNMRAMIYGCSALSELDLRSFNISKVENMEIMFKNSSGLITIYCDEDWSTSATLTTSENMFTGCTKLKGGNGTEYDENNVNVTYARPDKPGQLGYFTAKNTPTSIDQTNQKSTIKNQKLIKDGQLLILRDGKTYTVQGQEVK